VCIRSIPIIGTDLTGKPLPDLNGLSLDNMTYQQQVRKQCSCHCPGSS
jgi:hypothetical protein